MDMRWDAPGIVMLDVGVAPPGQDRKGRVDVLQGHFATPETENTTHYLWIGSRMDVGEPPEVNEKFCEFARNAFENEDLPFIEAAQDAMKGANFWKEDPVVFPQDTGALRARRTLDDLIRNEQKMETGVAAELA
jgi:vanillate O-demethylase monooxygenase subunit